MGLYNFKPQFVPMILDGTKTHTIRAPRKGSQDVPGNTMHLYTGLRTKKAKPLGRFECVKVEEIRISPMGMSVWINGMALCSDERDLLAWRDGFRHPWDVTAIGHTYAGCFDLMMKFWDGQLPFNGHIFHWRFDEKQVNR